MMALGDGVTIGIKALALKRAVGTTVTVNSGASGDPGKGLPEWRRPDGDTGECAVTDHLV